MKKFLFAGILSMAFCLNAESKTCTESTIRDALSKKKKFDFDAEGCSDEIIYVRSGIKLSGSMTIDGKNKMRLSWKGDGSQCDEKPRGDSYATFYTAGNNNVMKNFTILLSPEGIHLGTGKNNVVDNVTFERICEDAITNGNKGSSSATGSVIKNSRFYNGPDKAIQCNGGSVTVQNSVFKNIPRSIGACSYKADPGNHAAKECPTVCHIKAYDNKVYGCRGYAFRGAGYLQKKKEGTLTAIGNYFEGCSKPIMASQYGYVYAEDNTAAGKCDAFANTEEHGRGDICSNNTSSCKKEYQGDIAKRCLKQDPPPSNEPPSRDPSSDIVEYTADGKGGTNQKMSRSEQEKLACSRAKDRALVSARARCDGGKVIGQSTDECKNRCKTSSSGGVTCEATASITCNYGDEDVSVPSNPTPEPEPEPEPTPPTYHDRTVSAEGKGGTTKGDKSAACDRAQERAIAAAKNKCAGEEINAKASSCSYDKKSSKEYVARSTATLTCRE